MEFNWLHYLCSLRQFRQTKWSIFVHSPTLNVPYVHVHPRFDSILELCRTFPIGAQSDQRLLLPSEETLDHCLPIDHPSKSLIRLCYHLDGVSLAGKKWSVPFYSTFGGS